MVLILKYLLYNTQAFIHNNFSSIPIFYFAINICIQMYDVELQNKYIRSSSVAYTSKTNSMLF